MTHILGAEPGPRQGLLCSYRCLGVPQYGCARRLMGEYSVEPTAFYWGHLPGTETDYFVDEVIKEPFVGRLGLSRKISSCDGSMSDNFINHLRFLRSLPQLFGPLGLVLLLIASLAEKAMAVPTSTILVELLQGLDVFTDPADFEARDR